MSERAILRTIIVYFLIGCFLVSNVSCVYASSEASADSYENKTNPSEEKMQPSQKETQNSEEQLQPSDTNTQSSENDKVENPDVQTSENEGTETSEYKEIESVQATKTDSSENSGAKPVEEIIEDSSDNKKTVSLENTEAQSSNVQVGSEDTGTQTSGETQVSEDTETESSHHTGNSYHIEHSEYTKIENNKYVQSEPSQKAASGNSVSSESSKLTPPSASVSLHGEKTQVVSGEDIMLKLSAVNLITKPVMHIQVIIIPPSGMSVSSSEFVQSGAGQYTTTYDLEPGQGRDIEVRIETNQPGDFDVKGRVVYYFGEDTKKVEDYTLDLPIQVEAKPYSIEESLPGFTLTSLVFILIFVFILKRH
jgi:hypothetical protein